LSAIICGPSNSDCCIRIYVTHTAPNTRLNCGNAAMYRSNDALVANGFVMITNPDNADYVSAGCDSNTYNSQNLDADYSCTATTSADVCVQVSNPKFSQIYNLGTGGGTAPGACDCVGKIVGTDCGLRIQSTPIYTPPQPVYFAQNPGTSTITCNSLYATTCSSRDTLYVGPLNLCWNGNTGSYPIGTNNGIGQPLPSSATKLYGFAFASCALLTSVTFSIGTSCAYKSATVTTTVSPTNQVQLLSYLYYVFVDLSSNPVSYPAGSNFVLHDCLPSSTSWAHYQIFSYCACCSTGSGSGSSNNNDQFMVSFKVDA